MINNIKMRKYLRNIVNFIRNSRSGRQIRYNSVFLHIRNAHNNKFLNSCKRMYSTNQRETTQLLSK